MSSQNDVGDLSFTGERGVVPGKTPQFQVLEHLVRYGFAARFAGGCKVLDVGCGSGYGASSLAQEANRVVGIDSASEALNYAQKNYRRANLNFVLGDCRSLPFRECFFDVALMFEVIQHVAETETIL
jgi:ubiquinone/menaquinone biosynthesis C-methylase UbiE